MAHATSAPHRERRGDSSSDSRQALARRRPSLTADLVYDAFFGGGIAGSVIALFFLALDIAGGSPLYTPAMMGSALFGGVTPASVETIRLDMVAYFSILHFATFALLSVALSYLCRVSRLVEGHVLVMTGLAFAVLTVVILAADWLLMPGVVGTLGYGRVLAANALTGLALAAFMKWSHKPGRYGGPGPEEP
jgi:hypothetical protein